VSFGAVHKHYKKQDDIRGQTDDAVSLFALVLDKVVFLRYVVRVAKYFPCRLKRDPVKLEIPAGFRRVPRESRFHILLSYIQMYLREASAKVVQRARLSGAPDSQSTETTRLRAEPEADFVVVDQFAPVGLRDAFADCGAELGERESGFLFVGGVRFHGFQSRGRGRLCQAGVCRYRSPFSVFIAVRRLP